MFVMFMSAGLKLVFFNLVFLVLLAVAVLVPLFLTRRAAFAVLKRNFLGYFSNPTGYVFLCLFVFLTCVAAFCPAGFFAANLANLDQLNYWLPAVMLIFVPAITMSLWAEERRQGTDELLLTLPADDFDIVIGKYLAAAATFTVSLLFSQFSTFVVLILLSLGEMDVGLFFATYIGYWLIGLAMLAIGMVASFLTNNLTVSFILGLVFNAIPVSISYLHAMMPPSTFTQDLIRWSFSGRFDDFGRGVLSLSSTAYFLFAAAIGIYISVVLIGKRHWGGRSSDQSSSEIASIATGVALLLLVLSFACFLGQSFPDNLNYVRFFSVAGWTLLTLAVLIINGSAILNILQGGMLGHFMIRIECLLALMIGCCWLLSRHDRVSDLTEGEVSSISADTRTMLRELDPKRPIVIDAYISAYVPDEYAKTKYSLISILKEIERSAKNVRVNLHDNLQPFDAQVLNAEERFGITRQRVISRTSGSIRQEEFVLGAAFSCGLEKVVAPFFGNGVPVEYELIRSISTVANDTRKRLGIVADPELRLMGGFSFQGMQPREMPKQLILGELEKQYRVEEVKLDEPIDPSKYDVLLAIQPSALGPQQLQNLVAAVKAGIPTAIFEDPLPAIMGGVPGTNQPKPAPGGMFGMGGQPPPKGNIAELWTALGIQTLAEKDAAGNEAGAFNQDRVPAVVVWQEFNPYPRFGNLEGLGPELVFLRDDAPVTNSPMFNREETSVSRFEELLLPFPGGVKQGLGAKTRFTPLISTGELSSGTVTANDLAANMRQRGRRPASWQPENTRFILGARIRGDAPAEVKPASGPGKDGKPNTADAPQPRGINATYICDIDMLDSQFVMLRNQPDPENNFRFDNVPFVLNVIDDLAGDKRFLEIRKRKPRHATLKQIQTHVTRIRDEETKQIQEFQKELDRQDKIVDDAVAKARTEVEKIVAESNQARDRGELDAAKVREFQDRITIARLKLSSEERAAEIQKKRHQDKFNRDQMAAKQDIDRQISSIQNQYKLFSAAIFPLPPLLVGIAVFVYRRIREREGISKSRMRQ